MTTKNKLYAGGRHDMPQSSPPSVGAEAPSAEHAAHRNIAVVSHTHRCSCLTR